LKLKLSQFNCIELLVCEQLVVRRGISTDLVDCLIIDCCLTKIQLNSGVSCNNLMDFRLLC